MVNRVAGRNGVAVPDPLDDVLSQIATIDVAAIDARIAELVRQRSAAVDAIDQQIKRLRNIRRIVCPVSRQSAALRQTAVKAAVAAGQPSLRERVLRYVAHSGPAKNAVITADLQDDAKRVGNAIGQLVHEGKLRRLPDGRVTIPKPAEDDA